MNVKILDCTLRDGAYIVDGKFGEKSIIGILNHLQNARVDIVECGWLKNNKHISGSTYYNVPCDIENYIINGKDSKVIYTAMIDYNRYDLEQLPICDGKSVDAIRIVFPQDKVSEGLKLVNQIRDKGYKVYLQAANTYGYSEKELLELVNEVNNYDVEALSIVDTFGTMYKSDLFRILDILDNNLRKEIAIGFHSHNNKQLSFSLSMDFVEELFTRGKRDCIIDSSLCGMGRGAGNTPTELMISYLNKRFNTNYDENTIMDVIDMYMQHFMEKYKWGYSVPYMLAGTYVCHVNNVAYLMKTHRACAKDMKNVFENMSLEKRRTYDYDYLEQVYADVENKQIDDKLCKEILKKALRGREIVIVVPGVSAGKEQKMVSKYVSDNDVITIGINSVIEDYKYDYAFFSNSMKYTLALNVLEKAANKTTIITTSNIDGKQNLIVNYNDLVRRKWKYYENSLMMFLELMIYIRPAKINFVGFDGFEKCEQYYAEEILEPIEDFDEIDILQSNVVEMFQDFVKRNQGQIELCFLTHSLFEKYI